MAVKSGKPIEETRLSATTDSTVVSTGASETKEVYSLAVHDEGGAGATVDLYLSDNATSASGDRIERIVLAGDETKEFKPVAVGASKYLVIQSTVVDVIYHGAYTLRNGGDV
jgi:hypothetical protein